MKRLSLIRTGLLAVAAGVCFGAALSTASAAGMTDAHAKAGMTCASCHASPGAPVPESACTSCHNPEVLKKKTDKVVPTNPHVSPHYDLTCTHCHAAHKPGTDFCAQCHRFDFRVP